MKKFKELIEYILRLGKPQLIRHGDLGLVLIKSLPEGLTETKTDVVMQGKSNTHLVKGAQLYFKQINAFIFGYMAVSKKAVLYHKEHGKTVNGKPLKEVPLKKGYYELRKQNEDTHDGMKPVVD